MTTTEWGYRIGDDSYVVQMRTEEWVRQIARRDPSVVVVRRFVTEWEEASEGPPPRCVAHPEICSQLSCKAHTESDETRESA